MINRILLSTKKVSSKKCSSNRCRHYSFMTNIFVRENVPKEKKEQRRHLLKNYNNISWQYSLIRNCL